MNFSWASDMKYNILLWCWAETVSHSSQPHDREGKQLVLYSIFIVLDDFVQARADVSVLGTFKVV